jgi:hypothetical protein
MMNDIRSFDDWYEKTYKRKVGYNFNHSNSMLGVWQAATVTMQAKVDELARERDVIIGLLKQLRVDLYNLTKDEMSDLEYIYEINMCMKKIDFMFLHGYLQDGTNKILALELANKKLRDETIEECAIEFDKLNMSSQAWMLRKFKNVKPLIKDGE